MNNQNTFKPSEPIEIKTNFSKLDMTTNKEAYSTLQTLSPTSNINPASPMSSTSSASSAASNLDNQQQSSGFRRRLSLNLGPSVFSPFFRSSGSPPDDIANSGGVKPERAATIPQRMRTLSTSEYDTNSLAAKWGFGIRETTGGTFPRQNKPRPNFLQQLHEEAATRPKSPMGDMILNGQFLD